jgi:hypothetical protein
MPQLTRSGVDTGNPQLAEDALLGTAVTVGILPSLHHRFFGDAEDVTAATAETLGQGQNFFVAGASRYTTFDARHVLLLVRQLIKGHGRAASAPCDPYWSHAQHRTTQVALVLGGLLGQDVTLEGLTALDGATRTNAEALLRAALGLHFGHVNAPSWLCS